MGRKALKREACGDGRRVRFTLQRLIATPHPSFIQHFSTLYDSTLQ